MRNSFRYRCRLRDKLSDTNDAVIRIRELRKQLDEYAKRDSKKVADAAKALNQKLTEVEEALYQTKNRASEDPLNFRSSSTISWRTSWEWCRVRTISRRSNRTWSTRTWRRRLTLN